MKYAIISAKSGNASIAKPAAMPIIWGILPQRNVAVAKRTKPIIPITKKTFGIVTRPALAFSLCAASITSLVAARVAA